MVWRALIYGITVDRRRCIAGGAAVNRRALSGRWSESGTGQNLMTRVASRHNLNPLGDAGSEGVLSRPPHPQPLQNVSSFLFSTPTQLISRRLRPRPPLCFSRPYEPLRVCLPAAIVLLPPPFRRIAGMSRDHAHCRKDRDGRWHRSWHDCCRVTSRTLHRRVVEATAIPLLSALLSS